MLLETVSDDFLELVYEIDALSARRARDVIRYHRSDGPRHHGRPHRSRWQEPLDQNGEAG